MIIIIMKKTCMFQKDVPIKLGCAQILVNLNQGFSNFSTES